MNQAQPTKYPASLKAVRKGKPATVLDVTQLNNDSFQISLPSNPNLGIASNYYSEKAFHETYDLVAEK